MKTNKTQKKQETESPQKETAELSEDIIIKEWAEAWMDSYPTFTQHFSSVYRHVCTKAEENRNENFKRKYRIVLLFRVLMIVQLFYAGFALATVSSPVWMPLFNRIFHTSHSRLSLINVIPHDASLLGGIEAVLLISFLMVFIAENSWLNIKKYQETWARHRTTQLRLQQEMLRYLNEVEPYDVEAEDKRKKEFMKRALSICDDNIQAFHKNLSEKEVPLLKDMLSLAGGDKKEKE